MSQSMDANHRHLADLLRAASRCTGQCSVDVVTVNHPSSAPTFVVCHNGQDVEIPIGDLTDDRYDAVDDFRQRWVSKAADLHREEAMQSDWPVY